MILQILFRFRPIMQHLSTNSFYKRKSPSSSEVKTLKTSAVTVTVGDQRKRVRRSRIDEAFVYSNSPTKKKKRNGKKGRLSPVVFGLLTCTTLAMN